MKEMLTNRILTGLPDAEFARLLPLLEPVALSADERLAHAGERARYAYFPEDSVITAHADMFDGKSAEVGMIGREGVAGVAPLGGARPSAHSLKVAVAGAALRMWQEEFERELTQSEAMRHTLAGYTGEYVTQVAQRAACAILHRMEQRLAVWLLLLADRLGAGHIEITHERIASHLGVRRAGVTEVAGELQHRGVISYTRGSLRVVDREALEAVACECYGALSRTGQQTAMM